CPRCLHATGRWTERMAAPYRRMSTSLPICTRVAAKLCAPFAMFVNGARALSASALLHRPSASGRRCSRCREGRTCLHQAVELAGVLADDLALDGRAHGPEV